ncbi:sigma-70 family RNA polymerase sigma factor [bacterium]|nr:sigma-70 family RNA polymerase sigma factor [bacterium]
MTSSNSGAGRLTSTDHSLASRVKDGDQDAAHVLYKRYVQRVFGLVDSRLGAKLRATIDAEDIVQSVFRSMFRGVQAGNYEVEPGSTLWNLLAVISLTKLRKRAHHQTAQRRNLNRLVSLQTLADGDAIDVSTDDFLNICIRETMQKLRPSDRQILLLRIQGFTLAEISERTSFSCRTIARRLRTSRKHLASLLLEDE